MHLYFVKLFGCRIVDESMPIDIASFARSISNTEAHEHIYLSFNYRDIDKQEHVSASQVEFKFHNGACEIAMWYYTIGELDVQITWLGSDPIGNVRNAWHPNERTKIIKLRAR